MDRVADEGGAKHPSEASEGAEILAKVLAMIGSIAMDSRGRKSDGTTALDALRRAEDREAHLRQMVLDFSPPEANPEIWLRWLSGSSEPFPRERLKKPVMGQLNSGKEMSRRSQKVLSSQAKVAAARLALERAESDLARDVEHESSIITWAVMDTIAKLVMPIFAMGPAWTLMRVVGPHVDADEMAEELILETDDKLRRKVENHVRDERVALSQRIHRALDLWAGDAEFEIALRRAIVAVIEEHEPRKDEARSRGRKVRSSDEMVSSVRADPAAPRRAVLGLKGDD